jgi:hypothetical protein
VPPSPVLGHGLPLSWAADAALWIEEDDDGDVVRFPVTSAAKKSGQQAIHRTEHSLVNRIK